MFDPGTGSDLELVAELVGHEEVQLDRLFVLLLDAGPHEDETEGMVPRLGLPPELESPTIDPQGPPRPTCLDDPFEFHETLEGNAEGELDALLLDPGERQVWSRWKSISRRKPRRFWTGSRSGVGGWRRLSRGRRIGYTSRDGPSMDSVFTLHDHYSRGGPFFLYRVDDK